MYIWNSDLLAKSITGQTPVPAGQMVYYPSGVDHFKAYEASLMYLLALPFMLIFKNPILANNLVILFGFVTTALATYALVFYLTRSRNAATFGGLMFGLSPFMLVRSTQHPHFLLAFGLPLVALFVIRFIETPQAKTGLALGLAVFFTGLASWYYLVCALIFIALAFALYAKKIQGKTKPILVTFAAVLTGTLLPALPMLLSGNVTVLSSSLDYLDKLSTQLANVILPHALTSVLGAFTKSTYDAFPSVFADGPNYFESTSYIGLPVIALLALLYIYRRAIQIPFAKLWVTSAAVFGLLALGTSLKLGFATIPLPYRILVHYPPFSFLRSSNRFIIITLLATTVLACYFLKFLPKLISRRTLLAAATLALASLLLIERWIYPYPLIAPQISGFYYHLAYDKAKYAIADLPIDIPGFSVYNLYQTVHGKPIVSGHFFYPAFTKKTFEFIYQNPLLAHTLCYSNSVSDNAPIVPTEVYDHFRKANVRYLVLHPQILEGTPGCQDIKAVLYNFFLTQKPIFRDRDVSVYEVPGF